MLGLEAPLATLVLSTVGGVLGAALLVVPMTVMQEGLTPARAWTAMRENVPLEDVSVRQAILAHHVAGLGFGLCFGVIYLIADLIPVRWLVPAVLGGSTLTASIYFLFSRVVLPTVTLPGDRVRTAKFQLIGAAFVYGMLVMILVPSLAAAV